MRWIIKLSTQNLYFIYIGDSTCQHGRCFKEGWLYEERKLLPTGKCLWSVNLWRFPTGLGRDLSHGSRHYPCYSVGDKDRRDLRWVDVRVPAALYDGVIGRIENSIGHLTEDVLTSELVYVSHQNVRKYSVCFFSPRIHFLPRIGQAYLYSYITREDRRYWLSAFMNTYL